MGNVVFFVITLTAGGLSLVLGIPDGELEDKNRSQSSFVGGIGLILFVICIGYFLGAKYIADHDWTLSNH